MHRPGPGRRAALALVVAVALLAVAVGWYALPHFDDGSGRVTIYGGGTIESAIAPVLFQLRDRGHDPRWAAIGSTWCDLAATFAAGRVPDAPSAVLAPDTTGGCEGDPVSEVLRALGAAGVDPVVVAFGAAPDGLASDTTVVDTSVLLGGPDVGEMPCEWWDNCVGTVAVRDATGGLTDAGNERVARAVAGAIG